MPKRRELMLGMLSLGLGALGVACRKSRAVKNAGHGGVDFKLLVPSEPDDQYPLVVAVHGRGGAPEHWVDGWKKFPGRAHIALPRGFLPHEDGFAWFPWSTNVKDATLASAVSAAEERLWKGIVALAAGRRVVVAGYEQGAVLCYAMAARRADAVLGAFPVAGACPEALLPKAETRAAPVVAFHGATDDVFTLEMARTSVDGFQRAGARAELRSYAGVGHTPTDELHRDLNDAMLTALEGRS